MQSSVGYYFFFKYGFLGFAIFFMVMAILSLVVPELASVNGETVTHDIYYTAIFGIISVILFLIFLLIKDKFVIVTLGSQNITITKGNDEQIIAPWLEVVEIKRLWFIHPPLYQLTVKGHETTFLFNTHPSFISIFGFVVDISEMGELIRKKKRELGI